MKRIIRYIFSIVIALLASLISYRITFEIVEDIQPSKRYDATGHPEFVMPIGAILWALIISFVTLILIIVWMNKYLKNKYYPS
ncbi:MAG: hypothetical protein V4548_09300 [Bacteroidota bacterium]